MTEILVHYLLAGAYIPFKNQEYWPKSTRFHTRSSDPIEYIYFNCWYADGYGWVRGFGTSRVGGRYI